MFSTVEVLFRSIYFILLIRIENETDGTSGAGIAYRSGSPDFNRVFIAVRGASLFVSSLLAIVLSVLLPLRISEISC